MASAIRAIPTLTGEAAECFLHRAEEAERNFTGFDWLKTNPDHLSAMDYLHKQGMI